ncbi:hypothetical protein SLA2020_272070 [Shorea laevis]
MSRPTRDIRLGIGEERFKLDNGIEDKGKSGEEILRVQWEHGRGCREKIGTGRETRTWNKSMGCGGLWMKRNEKEEIIARHGGQGGVTRLKCRGLGSCGSCSYY